MTSRTVSIEAVKRRLHARLNAEFGDVQQTPEAAPAEPEKYWLHVEFDTRSPSVILPIVGVVTEYAQNIATVTTNMKSRRR